MPNISREQWLLMTEAQKQRIRARYKPTGLRNPDRPDNMSEAQMEAALTMCQIAVDYYNNDHKGDEIQLAEFLVLLYGFFDFPMVHINFMAKPKSSDCPDQSPKLFFAELKIVGMDVKQYQATICTTLGEDAAYDSYNIGRPVGYYEMRRELNNQGL